MVFEDVGLFRFLLNLYAGKYLNISSPNVHLPGSVAAWYVNTSGGKQALSLPERRMHKMSGQFLAWVIMKSAQQRFQPKVYDKLIFRMAAFFGSPKAHWQKVISSHRQPDDALGYAADILLQKVFQDQLLAGLSPSGILQKCYAVLLDPSANSVPVKFSGSKLSRAELYLRLKLLREMQTRSFNKIKVITLSGEILVLPIPDDRKGKYMIIDQLKRLGLKVLDTPGVFPRQRILNRFQAAV